MATPETRWYLTKKGVCANIFQGGVQVCYHGHVDLCFVYEEETFLMPLSADNAALVC